MVSPEKWKFRYLNISKKLCLHRNVEIHSPPQAPLYLSRKIIHAHGLHYIHDHQHCVGFCGSHAWHEYNVSNEKIGLVARVTEARTCIAAGQIEMLTANNPSRMTSSNGNVFRFTGLCEGNPPIICGFPSQSPVTRSFDALFDLRMSKRLSKQAKSCWFETPSRSLWRDFNATYLAPMIMKWAGGYRVRLPCRFILTLSWSFSHIPSLMQLQSSKNVIVW